ncbi:MAG: hypothetical protein WC964_03470 [Acholeplasmataceae bacterium]
MRDIIKKYMFLLIVSLIAVISACQKQMTVEKVIDLIQIAEKEDHNVVLAQEAFSKLSENEKRAVSNYTKLFYLNHEPPTTYTVEVNIADEKISTVYFTLNPRFSIVKSKEDIKTVFFFIDFEDLLDDIDDEIFENKTVIATTENYSWSANQAEEELSVCLDSQYNRLKLDFMKKGDPIFDFSTHYVRLIVLDTVYPLDIQEVTFSFLQQSEKE